MKKVFQTVVSGVNGNCMQAAVASLFGMELWEVPNFIEYDNCYEELDRFFVSKGYPDHGPLNPQIGCGERNGVEKIVRALEYDGGVNGFFYASVRSRTFEGVFHAVVIDTSMRVVHDPNPNQKALGVEPAGIEQITVCRGDWYLDVDGSLVVEKEQKE